MDTNKVLCSFCGDSNKEKPVIITSGKESICNECVASCEVIIKDSTEKLKYTKFNGIRNVFKVDFRKNK